jgi:hypothetical protein
MVVITDEDVLAEERIFSGELEVLICFTPLALVVLLLPLELLEPVPLLLTLVGDIM